MLDPAMTILPKFTFDPRRHLSVGEVANEIFEPEIGTHPNSQFEALLKAVLLAPVQVYVFFTVMVAVPEFVDAQAPLVTIAL